MRHSGEWFLGSNYYKIKEETKRRDIEGTAPFFAELNYDAEVQKKIMEMLNPTTFCKLAKMRRWDNEDLRKKFRLE